MDNRLAIVRISVPPMSQKHSKQFFQMMERTNEPRARTGRETAVVTTR
jgi:hypothetical protein